MNLLRRLPLSRLLLVVAIAIAIGVSATALALALGAGPTPPRKTLAQAVHDALAAPPPEGLSANVTLTNNLLEGANLAAGGEQGDELSSDPLMSGGSGRMWVGAEGHFRLELQSEKGDTELTWDGSSFVVYDAATNTVYRYTPEADERKGSTSDAPAGQPPSIEKIESAISRVEEHAELSPATPDDVAGQPAYTVRLSPRESGGLFGSIALSFDADNGVPLRSAVYSSQDSSPVIELAATSVSFGAVPSSTLRITPPADATVKTIEPSDRKQSDSKSTANRPKVTVHGRGPTAIAVLEAKQSDHGSDLGDLPKVSIDGTSASELRTELGTLLTFERNGVRYLLAGSVAPGALEALARGL